MRFAFSVAYRFLASNKAQTVLIALGIAVGVAVQIFIGLLIQGLQAGLVDRTVGNSPHVTVAASSRNERFTLDAATLASIADNDAVIVKGLVADGAAFVQYGDKSEPLLLRGVTLEGSEIYNLANRLVSGSLHAAKGEVTLGAALAEALGVASGDTVAVVTPQGDQYEFLVTGVFNLGVAALNEAWAFTGLADSQGVFGYGEALTAVELQVRDIFAADALATELQAALPQDVSTVSWQQANAELLSGLRGQSVSSNMIQVFVLLSVVLGIASVLAITVLQKSRQIGILKAMGINDRLASQIFLFQGLILGSLGAFLGVALGVGLLVAFTYFTQNPDGTSLISITFDPAFVALSGAAAVVSALVASFIPAKQSARLTPIEVIRNG